MYTGILLVLKELYLNKIDRTKNFSYDLFLDFHLNLRVIISF